MPRMALHLKSGIPLEGVIAGLREASIVGRNPLPMGFAPALNHYLSWVNNQVEPILRNYFLDPAVWTPLRGDAYWHIQAMTESSPHWYELVEGEMKRQAEHLESIETMVQSVIERANAAPGAFAVLDTHVLLHYTPPAEVPWPAVVGQPDVRLVLPLRVIEELDEKKYTARDDLADRARRLLSQLQSSVMAWRHP